MATRALLALVAMLFVSVPMVDAIACGPELVAAADVHATAPDDDADRDRDDPGHAACQHGHCHHGQIGVDRTRHDAPALSTEAIKPFAPLAHSLLSSRSAGLRRPPRA